MKIYDCFIFNDELDLLEMRLKYYWDDVDVFVLVESGTTFSGLKKKLSFSLCKERFKWAESKLRHIVHKPNLEEAGEKESDEDSLAHDTFRWRIESQQRNAMLEGCSDAEDEDVLVFSDVDEFPKLSVIKEFSGGLYGTGDEPASLELINHYYYLNFQGTDGAKFLQCSSIVRKKFLMSPQELRDRRWTTAKVIHNAGWHFSYTGGADKIIKKISSFSHTEYDKPEYKDKERIEKLITGGEDLFGREDFKFRAVDVNGSDDYDDRIKGVFKEYQHLIYMKDNSKRKKICLNMIVKDETRIIENCLRSVAPYLDYYIICDTGSSDDTKEKIKKVMGEHGVSGEIHDIEFRDFEYSRNKALDYAHNSDFDFDYILLDDADMIFEVEDENWREGLEHDYCLVSQYNELSYYNVRLIRKGLESKYIGVTHEYVACKGSRGTVDTIRYHDLACGSSRKEKYERDALLLLKGIEEEKEEGLLTRYYFYLGQTFFDMQRPMEAIKHYKTRIERGCWAEEVFYSKYRIGLSYRMMQDEAKMLEAFMEAFEYRPQRIEPLYELASYYREREKYFSGYMFAKMACTVNFPDDDLLFVGKDIYNWKRWDELSVCAFWVGLPEESANISKRLLSEENVPAHQRQRIEKNLSLAEGEVKKRS